MNFKKVTTGVLAGAMLASLAAVPVSAADEHHAYLLFQTSGFAFRDGWDNSDTGLDSAYDFSKVHCQLSAEEKVDGKNYGDREGTITDVTFTGDGTYTVAANGIKFGDIDFSATASCPFNLLGVSTDLDVELLDPEADNGFSFVIDSFKINGKEYTVGDHQINNYEDSNALYASDFIIHAWQDAEYKTFTGLVAGLDTTDIEVTFTVKGLSSEEAGDVAPVAYLAALAAIAGIAMVASKKRA